MSGYILDLRDNPGGLVKAGMDIARLLLDGHPTVFSIVGRAGEAEQKVMNVVRHLLWVLQGSISSGVRGLFHMVPGWGLDAGSAVFSARGFN